MSLTTLLDRAVGGGSREPAAEAKVPLLQRPLASYHLLMASTLLLLALGMVMVFSASALRAYDETGSLFAIGFKQAIYIGLGLPVMYGASRVPVWTYRRFAYPVLAVALALLLLVLFIGDKRKGATSWIPLPGGFNLQPAELAKFALLLWGADLLARKARLLGEYRHLLVPLVPMAVLVLGLVMLQPDFGTAVIIGTIVMALLWVVGMPMRLFGGLAATAVTLGTFYALSSPHALARLTSFRDPFADDRDSGFQAVQGFYALSSGGWFGLGLGASREKWTGGLPEAHTDYIFAIIGEELGLLGTLTVLALFTVLIYAGIRIAQRTDDLFVRLASTAVTAWLAVQAIVNMGAVVGLLPITGIPLPLVSFGGSAILVTLGSIGMLLSFARLEPGAADALRSRPGLRERLPAGVVPAPRRRTADRPLVRAPRARAGRAPGRTGTSERSGRRPGRR